MLTPLTLRCDAQSKKSGLSAPALLCVLVISVSLLASVGALAQPREELKEVRFSKAELELLKRLDQIQRGAKLSTTMLKAAPFVQLFSSPDPVDVAVTIGTNDWDKIYGALSGLQKIQTCKTSEEITLWRDVDGNSYSSKKTQEFFDDIERKADAECH